MELAGQPYVLVQRAGAGSPARAQFGYRIPYLPDLLADHTLLGHTDGERLAEILSRWAQFVLGLRKWQGTAFALRFTARPELGSVDLAFLGRVTWGEAQIEGRAREVAGDLQAQLMTMGLPHQAMEYRDELEQILLPFGARCEIVEVRQHEERVRYIAPQQEADVVHPFWSPAGSWLLPFEAMLRQPDPVAVSAYLEPVQLAEGERRALEEEGYRAQTLAEVELRTYSEQTVRIRRDPQAAMAGRIFGAQLRRLSDPFLLLVQCASPDLSSAWTVARSVGAAITARREALAVETGEQELPSGFDVWEPRTDADRAAASQTFSQLAPGFWGRAQPPVVPALARLAYLADAKGAAAAFRLPISVRGGVPGIEVRQPAPDFEPGPRQLEAGRDELHLGDFRRGGAVTIKISHLTRHALITGFTGSGKTNTVLYLLNQLWALRAKQGMKPVPFLVIEAAKKEYRGLLDQPGFEDILIFTLGDETTSPFRLNPFELVAGVRVEAHLGRLQACFDAALPQFGILPSIIAESMERIYRDKGWKLTDRGGEGAPRLFPTMRDMYGMVIQVAESRGYQGETYHNIRAAAAGRIGSLLAGSKGRMFACQRSVPIEELMRRPVVLELNDLNQQDKSLTMMFLLMLLREHRELHKSSALQHVTVVEEAHNVLENVRSVGASEIAPDTRAKAVEAFAGILAEVRAYGEGILISDQSPEKLAPDAVRNTNLQIAHQLRHRTDRAAIAAAMIMDEAQQEYLGKLRVGEAAVFLTGYDRATFMQVPNYKDKAHLADHPDGRVASHMKDFRDRHIDAYLPFDGCRFCGRQCEYREALEAQTLDRELTERFKKALRRFDEDPEPKAVPAHWRTVADVCAEAGRRAGHSGIVDAGWCFMAHEIDFPFTRHMRIRFEEAAETWKERGA